MHRSVGLGRGPHAGLVALVALVATLALAGTVMAGNATGIDVQLPAVPTHGASVSGRITRASDGHAVAKAFVLLSHRGNASGGGIAVTGSQGRYTVSGLAAGKHVIRVWLAAPHSLQIGYYRAGASNHFTTSIAKATTVTVASTNISGRNVALPKGYTLSGRVTKASGGGPVVRESVTLTSGDNEESVETPIAPGAPQSSSQERAAPKSTRRCPPGWC